MKTWLVLSFLILAGCAPKECPRAIRVPCAVPVWDDPAPNLEEHDRRAKVRRDAMEICAKAMQKLNSETMR